MCFSAEISFGSGVVLTAIGVMSIRESKPNQLFFGLIPLICGVQQITEGFVWLSHQNNWSDWIQSLLNYCYLFFAFIVWPFWIPFSVYKLKDFVKYKGVLRFSIFLGILVSLYLGHTLIFYDVSSEIICYHIKYRIAYKPAIYFHPQIIGGAYLIAIGLPTIFHKDTWIKVVGFLIIVSYVLAKIIYTSYFTSVWCFFAALISVFVLYSIKKSNKTEIN